MTLQYEMQLLDELPSKGATCMHIYVIDLGHFSDLCRKFGFMANVRKIVN